MDVNTNTEVSQRFQTYESAVIEVSGHFEKIVCKMENLSASGAFFKILNSLYIPRTNDLVRITINLRSLKKVHTLYGRVVWSEGLGVGLKFLPNQLITNKVFIKL